MTNWTQIIDRLREMKNGAVDLPDGEHRQLSQEALRDLDRFFREKLFGHNNELTPVERDAAQEYYIQTL